MAMQAQGQLGDILAPGLRVVFCGLNPAATAAASGHNFSAPSNRFWTVLHLSGFTPHRIAAADDGTILQFGCGLTALVSRPTAQASEVSRAEFRGAAEAFTHKIERHAPRSVAFLGKAGYAAMAGRPSVAWGRQAETVGGAIAWVLPNPSGLNRAFRLQDLVRDYSALRQALDAVP